MTLARDVRWLGALATAAVSWLVLLLVDDSLSAGEPYLVIALTPGLLLAVLVLTTPDRWPPLVAGTAVGHVVATVLLDLRPGMAVLAWLALAGTPLLSATVLQRVGEWPFRLDSTTATIQFVLTTGVAATLVVGTLGGIAAGWAGAASGGRILGSWLAVEIGLLTLTPLVLAIRHQPDRRSSRDLEWLGVSAITVLLTSAIFAGERRGTLVEPEVFLLFPALIYAGLRFQALEVRVLTLGLTVVATAFTAAGRGPFADLGASGSAPGGSVSASFLPEEFAGLQAFLAVLALCALLLSSVSSERLSSETARAISERRLQATLAGSPVGLVMLGPEGRIERANRAFCTLVGRSATSLLDTPYDDMVPQPDGGEHSTTLELVEAAGRGIHQSDIQFTRPDGTQAWGRQHLTALHGEGGRVDGVLVQIEDITERKEIEEVLAYRATHDRLTGLANRDLFHDHLERALARARRHGSMVAVSFFDLDGFKAVNDVHGHAAGDELLRQVADRLRIAVRPEDLICRYGGDEFVICSEDLYDPAHAAQVAGRVLEAIARPYQLETTSATVGASIGVALSGQSEAHAESIVRDADAAMYRAKNAGGGRVEMFDPDDRDRHEREMSTVRELREAIHEGQLRVLYQPIVDLESRRLVSVEALVRWAHPVRGVVLPDEFIHVAEQSGLIHALGEWVLRTACRESQTWRLEFPDSDQPVLAVNISPLQLTDPGFTTRTLAVLEATGLAPDQLCLEITERAITDSSNPVVADNLAALERSGIMLAVDDFGTGYSSLTSVKQLPIRQVKIDRSFVSGLGTDAGDTAIVSSVMTMARSMGLEVVAEGVETLDQLDQLVRMGCTTVQGYLLSRPRPPASLARLAFGGGMASAATLWVPHDDSPERTSTSGGNGNGNVTP